MCLIVMNNVIMQKLNIPKRLISLIQNHFFYLTGNHDVHMLTGFVELTPLLVCNI